MENHTRTFQYHEKKKFFAKRDVYSSSTVVVHKTWSEADKFQVRYNSSRSGSFGKWPETWDLRPETWDLRPETWDLPAACQMSTALTWHLESLSLFDNTTVHYITYCTWDDFWPAAAPLNVPPCPIPTPFFLHPFLQLVTPFYKSIIDGSYRLRDVWVVWASEKERERERETSG
jgi:hypothetical protein